MNTYDKSDKYLMPTYGRFRAVIESGKGATCVTDDGRTLIDLGSGIGVNSLGYADDEWVSAVAAQASKLQHASNLYYTKPCGDLAELLCVRSGMSRAFFTNSGAEANECAMKLARKYSYDRYGAGRDKIISLVNSFHGRTMATLTATGQDIFHQYFFPFLPSHEYVKAHDIAEITEKADSTVCAVIIEVVQGEGGVIALDKEYVLTLSKLCKERDILLIVDEVQTGIGRTGKLFAYEHYGIQPDAVTLAKGLGGGLPIGACLCAEKYADVMTAGTHGTTYGGNPVVCAGALAVLNKVTREDFLVNVSRKADYITKRLTEADGVAEVSGLGMMIGARVKGKAAREVAEKCLERGVMVLTAKDKIRLLPPLNISDDELKRALDILISVINE